MVGVYFGIFGAQILTFIQKKYIVYYQRHVQLCTHRIMKYACNFFESCLHINIVMHSQKNCSQDIYIYYIEKPRYYQVGMQNSCYVRKLSFLFVGKLFDDFFLLHGEQYFYFFRSIYSYYLQRIENSFIHSFFNPLSVKNFFNDRKNPSTQYIISILPHPTYIIYIYLCTTSIQLLMRNDLNKANSNAKA